jgi:alkylated DNA repair dioxygenase AlkB
MTTQRIDLTPSSYLLYVEGFAAEADAMLKTLVEQIPWGTNMSGRVGRPRQTFWVGDFSYTYSGTTHEVYPWPDYLLELRRKAEELAFGKSEGQYRGVLLNHYRDGNDTIGMHSDDETEIEPGSPIASVSFGAERTFKLRPKPDVVGPKQNLKLASGSCLVMGGAMQVEYKHGITAEPKVLGARVNLTFRKYRL